MAGYTLGFDDGGDVPSAVRRAGRVIDLLAYVSLFFQLELA